MKETSNTTMKYLEYLFLSLASLLFISIVTENVPLSVFILILILCVIGNVFMKYEEKDKNGSEDSTSVDFLLKYLLASRLHSSTIHRVLALDSLNGGPNDSPSFFKSNIWYTIRHNPETRNSFNLYLSQVAELVKKIGSVSSVLPNEVWSQQSRDLVRSVEYLDSLFKNDDINDVFASNWSKIFTQDERNKAVALVNDVLSEQANTLKEVAEVLDKGCSEYRSTRQSEVSRNLDALRAEYMKGTLVESRIVSKQDDCHVDDTTGESSISDIWE
jgi:hypothetical protein